jgi:membrane AbrB-like protein
MDRIGQYTQYRQSKRQEQMMNLVVFFILGFLGGWLGNKSRMPGGAVVGALLFSGLGNFTGLEPATLPLGYQFVLQVMAGCLVGATITKALLRDLRSALVAVLLNGILIVAGAVGIAALISWWFGWDLATAWLSASPGRMPDMIIYADTVGADTPTVATAHILRMLAVIFLMPFILKFQKYLQRRQLRKQGGAK